MLRDNKGKKSAGPGDRAEVADLVDGIRGKDGIVIEIVLPYPNPAQLVTDSSYLGCSTNHRITLTWAVTR